jgi:hypothetical protein
VGYYCPLGTKSNNEYPCPGGFYNDVTAQYSDT